MVKYTCRDTHGEKCMLGKFEHVGSSMVKYTCHHYERRICMHAKACMHNMKGPVTGTVWVIHEDNS